MVITTTLEPGYLRALASGPFVLPSANRMFVNLLDVIAREHAERVLIDGRQITGRPRAIERYLYGVFVATAADRMHPEQNSHALKFAYVLLEPVLDSGRLGETTARRRGMSVRAFDNPEEAVDWLLAPDV
jgi:hypothetical protein